MTAPDNAMVEHTFLRSCAVGSPGDWEGAENWLRRLDSAQWEELHRYAVLHGFAGLLARNLAWARDRTKLDIPVVERLEQLRRGQLVQHLARKAAARRILFAFQERGIPFIVFKGVVIAEEIYGELSLRGFRDLDVMVPVDRLDEAFALCLDHGYGLSQFGHVRDVMAAGAHAAGMAHADGSGVDLHWSLSPELDAPSHLALAWKEARPAAPGASLPGMRLSPEMTLIHLAMHFHAHQYVSPKPLVDFFAAARRFGPILDGPQLLRLASDLDVLPMLDIAAGLAGRSFIAAALPQVLRERASTPHARIATAVVGERLLVDASRHSRIENWARYLVAAGGLRFTVRGLAAILVPSRLVLSQFFERPYAPAMYPRYYWRQVVKVLTLSAK